MVNFRMVVQLTVFSLLRLSIFIMMGTQAWGNDVVPRIYKIKFNDKPSSKLVVNTRSENGFHLLIAAFRPEDERQGTEAQAVGAEAVNSINPEMRAVISASDTIHSDEGGSVYYPTLVEPLLVDPHFFERTGQDDSEDFFLNLLRTLRPVTRNGGVMPSYAVLHGLESSAPQDREALLLPLPPINVSAPSESTMQIIPEINRPIVTATENSEFSVTGEVEARGRGAFGHPPERMSATAIFSHNTEDDSVRLESFSIDNLVRVERISPAEDHLPSQDGLMERLWNPLTMLQQVEEKPQFAELKAKLRAGVRTIAETYLFRMTQLIAQERECLSRILSGKVVLQKIYETMIQIASLLSLSPEDAMGGSVIARLQEENRSARADFEEICGEELQEQLAALIERVKSEMPEVNAQANQQATREAMQNEIIQLCNEEQGLAWRRILLRAMLQGYVRIDSIIREGTLQELSSEQPESFEYSLSYPIGAATGIEELQSLTPLVETIPLINRMRAHFRASPEMAPPLEAITIEGLPEIALDSEPRMGLTSLQNQQLQIFKILMCTMFAFSLRSKVE